MKTKLLSHLGLRLAAGLLAFTVTSALADVSITLNSNGGSPYTTSTGASLNVGSAVRVGFFNVTSPGNLAILQNSNNYAEVDALFTAFAEGNSGGGTVVQSGNSGSHLIMNDMFGAGNVFGQITGIDPNYCTTGDAMWVWVFNNADPLLATEWGIFSATAGWAFPANSGSETLSTSEVNNVVRGTNTGTELRLSNVSVVPEPGSLLLIMAAGAMLRRRRW